METIIFDVDDTLYDQTVPFRNSFKRLFDVPFSDTELDKLYVASRKVSDSLFDRCEAGEISITEMQIRRVTDAWEQFNIPITRDKAQKFQETYLDEQHKIQLFEEVEQLLELLHNEGKQLAILTNGEDKHQSMKIKQLGLERWIPKENHFISGALGVAKPNTEVFQIIEDRLKLDKKKTVYIGDSFDNDIVGAKKAGWQAIWMNHRKRKMPVGTHKPDKEMYHAKEMLEFFQPIIINN
ncbi:HAD family hydrolase [Aquibacillus koreensis]|uniref:HAD family hydrolase n=1 Tax=Aquibacillus koreensis TaxID=279446 RepID=A0A9X3WSL5_9BACI|nr:HAD family hydrolase [Aquibacillus koreensis]MCT2536074.1 HAD family hydrolase [Aquibacillus koreensis]MDC3422599.1 HAD family hydrolase [Aquibacillus koreensis]